MNPINFNDCRKASKQYYGDSIWLQRLIRFFTYSNARAYLFALSPISDLTNLFSSESGQERKTLAMIDDDDDADD